MLASDVMTRNVATVRPETPVILAITTMVESRISGLPVLDAQGQLVGILTEGDLLRRSELGTAPHRPSWVNFLRGPGLAAADYVRSRTTHVADIMTPSPVFVAPDTSLEEIVAHMEHGRIRRVPVVRNGVLVGIVSRADLVRALVPLMTVAPCGTRDDASIRDDILAEIAAQNWCAMSNVAVSVDLGRVKLEGAAQTEAVRTALRVAAERVPGVIAVQSVIVIPDPMVMAIGA